LVGYVPPRPTAGVLDDVRSCFKIKTHTKAFPGTASFADQERIKATYKRRGYQAWTCKYCGLTGRLEKKRSSPKA
jgi:hypothetical protein